MIRALLCSGQGRIEQGMFDRLDVNAESRAVLNSAAGLLGSDPAVFVAEAGEDVITQDRAGQILCVSRSLAAFAALGLRAPTMVAGYSVGEMAAWSIAGIWRHDQALRLTERRAELMDRADEGAGGLGFVRGLDKMRLDRLLARHSCAIAIRNPGALYIIGGLRSDVAACCAEAVHCGALAARPIAVRVASHTPRLAAAVAPFERSLAAEPARPAEEQFLLVGAATATVIPAATAETVSGLAHQLASTVDWSSVLTSLVERGAARMLELGPGDALAHMVRANWPDMDVRALDDFKTVDGARHWFEAA